jgi:hypothetical protein
MHAEHNLLSASPSTPNPKADRLRQTRREIRRAGSAFLDATELLQGSDYAVAVRVSELCDLLLRRLTLAERRSA